MKILPLMFLVIFAGLAEAHAGVYYVKADAAGANNGTSFANAYTDLQSALAAAQWGDEIWVAEGTYKPTAGTDRNKSFLLTPGARVYGGFAGSETAREMREWNQNQTILNGNIGSTETAADNSYHVVIGAYYAVLDGVTISGGSANGAGMYNNTITSMTVIRCTFTGNSTTGSGSSGGGMYNLNASPTVTSCTFHGNTSFWGGGMYNQGSSPNVTWCTFTGNTGTESGGGLFNYSSSSPKINNCAFISNASGKGAGMYNPGCSLTVTNCLFIGNRAGGSGGAICSGMPIITNCTFLGNTAGSGGGLYFDSNSNNSIRITNSILWNDSATIGPEVYNSSSSIKPLFRCCAIRGSGGSGALWNPVLGSDGGGNITTYPIFVDLLSPAGPDLAWMTADDGLRLQAASPSIDAGDPAGKPATDVLGNPRPGTPDIGAYEYQGGDVAGPPSTPAGGLEVTYYVKTPSVSPDGQPVTYTYVWTSDKGDSVTHGPTAATSDTLTEMNLVQNGETWTVRVTPRSGPRTGTQSIASVKFIDVSSGVWVWSLYR